LAQVFAQYPIEVAHGEGVWLYARDGRKILDFYGGSCRRRLGLRAPALVGGARAASAADEFQTNALPMAMRERAAAVW
jgi:4-aminobutyrate aminotransferase-like enzyme